MKSSLFKPIKIGDRELKNRIIAAPPPSMLASDEGMVTPQLVDYYQKLAASGVCAVILSGVAVSDSATGWHKQLSISHPGSLNGFSRVVEKIRQKGALPFVQLYHAGYNNSMLRAFRNEETSLLQLKGQKHYIAALSAHDIHSITGEYINAAQNAWNAGFSGIEIQAAEGSIVQQFLSPLTNVRSDIFGATTLEGAELLFNIVKGIKRVAPDLLLVVKLPLKDLIPGGQRICATLKTAAALKKMGVDLIHVTEGLVTGSGLKRHAALDKTAIEAPFAEDAQILKNETACQVILSGKISTPQTAEKKIKTGCCDMISLGRTLNRNPDWLKDAQLEIKSSIKPCLRCEVCIAASTGCPDTFSTQ